MILEDLHSVLIAQYLIPLSLCFFSVPGRNNGPTDKVVGLPPSGAAAVLSKRGGGGGVRHPWKERFHLIFNLDFYGPYTMGPVIFLPSLCRDGG